MSARPNDLLRIMGALENAQKALKFVDEFRLSEKHFTCDEPEDIIIAAAVNSVFLHVARMGEELSQISFSLASEHPELPWDKIRGTRNRMIHAYFNFDGRFLWEIVDQNLEEVIDFCSTVLLEMGIEDQDKISEPTQKPGHGMISDALGKLPSRYGGNAGEARSSHHKHQ